eukprot:328052-Chlamydomonas_euryale.AAC.2
MREAQQQQQQRQIRQCVWRVHTWAPHGAPPVENNVSAGWLAKLALVRYASTEAAAVSLVKSSVTMT